MAHVRSTSVTTRRQFAFVFSFRWCNVSLKQQCVTTRSYHHLITRLHRVRAPSCCLGLLRTGCGRLASHHARGSNTSLTPAMNGKHQRNGEWEPLFLLLLVLLVSVLLSLILLVPLLLWLWWC